MINIPGRLNELDENGECKIDDFMFLTDKGSFVMNERIAKKLGFKISVKYFRLKNNKIKRCYDKK